MGYTFGEAGTPFSPYEELRSQKRYNRNSVLARGGAEWEDPELLAAQIEDLKAQNRKINMSANPAFGGNSGMGRGGYASTPEMGEAGGNTNITFWKNNEKLRALMDIQAGGVGSGWRTKGEPEVVGPGGERKPRAQVIGAEGGAASPQYGGEDMPQTPYGALKQTGGMGSTSRDVAARIEMARAQEAEASAKAAELAARGADPEAKMNDELFNINTGRTAAVARGRAGAEAAGGLVKGQGEAATFFDPQVSMQRLRGQEAANEAVVNRYQMPVEMKGQLDLERQRLGNEGALARTGLDANNKFLMNLLSNYTKAATTVSLTEEQRQMAAQAASEIAKYLTSQGVPMGGIR